MNRAVIHSLIECEKFIKAAPKKSMSTDPRNSYTVRNDFTCASKDGMQFEVFMRKNTRLPLLFSIGLRYRSANGTLIICRYNGKHCHRNKIGDHEQLDDFHIHKLYDEQLTDGTDSAMDAEATKNYISFDEALLSFLTDCHIMNWEKYFPELKNTVSQLKLEGV